MFVTFGATDVSVMNGDFSKWLDEDLPQDSTEPVIVERELDDSWEYIASRVAELEQVHQASAKVENREEEAPAIIDSRDVPNFERGSVEGAFCVPTLNLFNKDTTFLPDEKLKELFKEAEGKPVVATCGAGIWACSTVFVLERLGHTKPISMFDGSWQLYSQFKVPDFSDPDWEKNFERLSRQG